MTSARILTGAFSATFFAHHQDQRGTGRVVYSVRGATITIWAAYPEHDEAYRRARRRYRITRKR